MKLAHKFADFHKMKLAHKFADFHKMKLAHKFADLRFAPIQIVSYKMYYTKCVTQNV